MRKFAAVAVAGIAIIAALGLTSRSAYACWHCYIPGTEIESEFGVCTQTFIGYYDCIMWPENNPSYCFVAGHGCAGGGGGGIASETLLLDSGEQVSGERISADAFAVRDCSGEQRMLYSVDGAHARRVTVRSIPL
jgi:hypothetical protein